MARIGDQVHTLTFGYLCVYATITDSVVPSILHRNTSKYIDINLRNLEKPDCFLVVKSTRLLNKDY